MLPTLLLAAIPAFSASLADLPLYFEPNRGQATHGVSFVARAPGYVVQVKEKGATISLDNAEFHMQLLGANAPHSTRGADPHQGISNYFTSPEESKWIRNVPHYGRVEQRAVYPGIDLVFYGSGRSIEYDFVVAPHANPNSIRFRLGDVRLAANGDLVASSNGVEIRHRKPVAWQEIKGRRVPVTASYKLIRGDVTFALAAYDKTQGLVIDPSIVYATFAGGSFGWTYGVAVDPTGAAYYSGRLTGVNGLAPLGGGFVIKVNPSGTSIVYVSYFGDVEPRGITVNSAGAAYVTGYAFGGLTVKNAIQPTPRGERDMFLTKINPAGNDLEFSTYYGGSQNDYGMRVALDASGGIHVLAVAESSDFPVSSGSCSSSLALIKFNETASRAIFSNCLAGAIGSTGINPFYYGFQSALGLAVQSTGNIVVSASVTSSLPLVNPVFNTPSGRGMIRVSPIGTVIQSTFLPAGGGPAAVDSLDNIYIGGTNSNLIPGQAEGTAAVAKLSPGGTDYSPVASLGSNVTIFGIAADGANNVYTAGSVQPFTTFQDVRSMQAHAISMGRDAFLTKISPTGSILYSTFYGGTNHDEALAVAADNSGAYLAGYSYSCNLPLVNPIATCTTFNNGIFVKITDTPDVQIVPVTIATTPPGLQITVDGLLQTSPATYNWVAGSTHTVSAATQGSGNVRYKFLNWQNATTDGTQTVTTPTTATTYTAIYQQEVRVITDVFPIGRGSVTINPPSVDGFYPVGFAVTATATPVPGVTFIGFTGSFTSTANPATTIVTANGTNAFLALANFSGVSLPGGFGFVPLAPCRLLDTRNGQRLTGNSTRDINVSTGACGIPANARAYSFNATVVPLQPLAYLTLFPTGQSRPLVSTLNAFEGQIIANAAIVPAGSGGSISAFATADTDLILDINGYFTESAGPEALVFYPVTPCRVIDTRPDSGGPGGVFGPPALPAAIPRSFPIPQSVCGIPAAAQAYAFNVTVVPFGPLDYISAFPATGAIPLASTQNSPQGRVLANMAIVRAGINGAISLYAPQSTHAVVDINGYFAPASTGAGVGLRFYTLSPCRLADTRDAGYASPNGPPAIPAATSRAVQVAGRCSVPTAQAYSLNATVVPPGYLGFITLYPGPTRPFVSTLNAWEGQVAANAALVPASPTGTVNVYVSNTTDFVLDINGYFAP